MQQETTEQTIKSKPELDQDALYCRMSAVVEL